MIKPRILGLGTYACIADTGFSNTLSGPQRFVCIRHKMRYTPDLKCPQPARKPGRVVMGRESATQEKKHGR